MQQISEVNQTVSSNQNQIMFWKSIIELQTDQLAKLKSDSLMLCILNDPKESTIPYPSR